MIIKLENLNTEEKTLIDSLSLKTVVVYLQDLLNNDCVFEKDREKLSSALDVFKFVSKSGLIDVSWK